jgi:hypothetical protein
LTPTRQELDVAGDRSGGRLGSDHHLHAEPFADADQSQPYQGPCVVSPLNIVLSNVGNVIYAVCVFSLPPGPIWAMHVFYLTATGLMLFWYMQRPHEPIPRLHAR